MESTRLDKAKKRVRGKPTKISSHNTGSLPVSIHENKTQIHKIRLSG